MKRKMCKQWPNCACVMRGTVEDCLPRYHPLRLSVWDHIRLISVKRQHPKPQKEKR